MSSLSILLYKSNSILSILNLFGNHKLKTLASIELPSCSWHKRLITLINGSQVLGIILHAAFSLGSLFSGNSSHDIIGGLEFESLVIDEFFKLFFRQIIKLHLKSKRLFCYRLKRNKIEIRGNKSKKMSNKPNIYIGTLRPLTKRLRIQ